jgi:hypothetical protein
MANTYVVGQVIEFPVEFLDDTQPYGNPIDPGAVTFKFNSLATPTPTTYTYTSATTPAPGVVAKLAVGSYEAQINTSSLTPSLFTYEWQTSGIGQTIGSSTFTLLAAAI